MSSAGIVMILDEDESVARMAVRLEAPFKQAKETLVEAFERIYAARLLIRFHGNISRAARQAGLSRRHFFELLKKHQLLPSAVPGAP